MQAARLSMQINVGQGTLEALENELLPVALGNPAKPVYRRLLVDFYGALAFPLIHEAQGTDPARREAAVRELARIGERAVKPLLDALSDGRVSQQRVAVELLRHINNRSAGAALFAYATGVGDAQLRARAMVAVGTLRDPRLLPKFSQLLAPDGEPRADESDPVMLAAAWAVARMESPKARRVLETLLRSEAPSIRALAALGLGRLWKSSRAREFTQLAADPTTGPVPRAAATFALGQLGTGAHAEGLARLAAAKDGLLRAHALLALARSDSALALRPRPKPEASV